MVSVVRNFCVCSSRIATHSAFEVMIEKGLPRASDEKATEQLSSPTTRGAAGSAWMAAASGWSEKQATRMPS